MSDLSEYPKYGTVANCAACGHSGDFSTQFHRERGTDDSAGVLEDISYIRRECPNCFYAWRELPLYLVDKRH